MYPYQEFLDFKAVTQSNKAENLVRQNKSSAFPPRIHTDHLIQCKLLFPGKMNYAVLTTYKKQIKSWWCAVMTVTWKQQQWESSPMRPKLSFKEIMKMWFFKSIFQMGI